MQIWFDASDAMQMAHYKLIIIIIIIININCLLPKAWLKLCSALSNTMS